ncbi:MAG: cyclase family protein [Phycisphaerales bacterium]|nr:MAG: cyclase family protein [Phycisphaerales bacterium]
MIYDITPAVSPALKVWPGDTPPTREVVSDLKSGATTTSSTLHSSVHLGAHADSPSHYGRNAPNIDEQPIDLYLGRCQVIHVDVPPATGVDPGMLGAEIEAPRVLIGTGTFPDPNVFNEDFAALSEELIEHFARLGVVLVGIDTPSVDLFTCEDLPTHKACLEHNVAILEGLVLADVPDGLYELIALPLKLVGFDASPVRAILRDLSC